MSPSATDPPLPSLAFVRERALEATDVAFVITDAGDPVGPIVWANDAFERVTGYSLDDVAGRNPPSQAPTDPLARRGCACSSRGPSALPCSTTGPTARPLEQVSLSPMRDDAGRIPTGGVRSTSRRRSRQRPAAPGRGGAARATASQCSGYPTSSRTSTRRRAAWIERLLGRRVVEVARFLVIAPGQPRPAGSEDPARLLDRLGRRDDSASAPLAAGTASRWARDVLRADEHATGALEERGSALVLPLMGRREPLGVLAVVLREDPAAGTVSEDGVSTLLRLTAHRVGVALDVMRLYAREHRLAETLQRAMLPEQAEIPDLDVWTYYAPSAEHAQVGGDWYDVLQIDDGLVGIVVGDVVGHDIEAAAVMGQLRSVVRSYAFERGSPGSVLERVDQLVEGMGMTRAASLVLGMLRATDSETSADDGSGRQRSWRSVLRPVTCRPCTCAGSPAARLARPSSASGRPIATRRS